MSDLRPSLGHHICMLSFTCIWEALQRCTTVQHPVHEDIFCAIAACKHCPFAIVGIVTEMDDVMLLGHVTGTWSGLMTHTYL